MVFLVLAIPWIDLRPVAMAAILAVRSIREGIPFDGECEFKKRCEKILFRREEFLGNRACLQQQVLFQGADPPD